MAFKMKGYQAHSKSPMKIKGVWQSMKKKAGEARDYKKDKTINMSNVVGMSKEEKASRDAFDRQEAARRKAASDKSKQASADHTRKTDLYAEYVKKNPQSDNERHKKAQAYADSKLKEEKATKKKQLASKSPQTEEQAKKDKNKRVPLAKKKTTKILGRERTVHTTKTSTGKTKQVVTRKKAKNGEVEYTSKLKTKSKGNVTKDKGKGVYDKKTGIDKSYSGTFKSGRRGKKVAYND